ncbi:hypothetical protein SNK04_014188 [Fusarium graminearum]
MGTFAAALGPVAGLAEDAETDSGQHHGGSPGEGHACGAEAVRFVKGNTPGANLWYAKARLTI